jgi:OOP family OmpA-OmpF porin
MPDVLAKRREPVPDSFDELRSLIVGPEQRELQTIQAHLLDPAVQVRDVSRVLPDAIAIRSGDPQLTRALAPTIEEALTDSVKRDPRPLADALFPVMGPAIRKAITHTLATMMESLNRTIEHSVSLRGLQWRWTALRTGRPFAEVVLLNTLQYRVEQVFLVHRETGLPLLHLSADPRAVTEADQISAMLTAIQDFVHDSFRTPAADGLDALRVGELTVIVEQGPQAILAGVVRGGPPIGLRTTFAEALEAIHLRFGPELESFNGDASPFERARPVLETCLVSKYKGRTSAPSYRGWKIAGALAAIALAAWAFVSYRERQRWNTYVDRLRAEPGIVVVADGRSGGRRTVSGLRDPLSADPAALASASGLQPASIGFQWEPYQAIRPAFVEARARDLLHPPSGVSFTYADGVLRAEGAAPARWIAETERLAPALAGVRRFVYGGVAPEARLKSEIESVAVLFPRGQSRPLPGQEAAVQRLTTSLTELNDLMRQRGQRVTIDVVGNTDADGSDAENGPLSRQRADVVIGLLPTARLDAMQFAPRGVGSVAPVATGGTDEAKGRNRRVSLAVVLPAAGGAENRR